ncbi:hypothetical protein D5R81_18355 [Parashewanella spongiae]|uniref:Uncharacterized protein n=1 Tax=Parashewanella spongiae TaxID=342950 RepID=A0A3A6TM87_9GAMM|nr:hypothetical protein [Parashewanella spongiae]MCL1077624.1 hypothetical protein [Parashewanella spongiae]RJY05858.1 hypothetical protein D5R81_18355 [Parashewanella spongiae]
MSALGQLTNHGVPPCYPETETIKNGEHTPPVESGSVQLMYPAIQQSSEHFHSFDFLYTTPSLPTHTDPQINELLRNIYTHYTDGNYNCAIEACRIAMLHIMGPTCSPDAIYTIRNFLLLATLKCKPNDVIILINSMVTEDPNEQLLIYQHLVNSFEKNNLHFSTPTKQLTLFRRVLAALGDRKASIQLINMHLFSSNPEYEYCPTEIEPILFKMARGRLINSAAKLVVFPKPIQILLDIIMLEEVNKNKTNEESVIYEHRVELADKLFNDTNIHIKFTAPLVFLSTIFGSIDAKKADHYLQLLKPEVKSFTEERILDYLVAKTMIANGSSTERVILGEQRLKKLSECLMISAAQDLLMHTIKTKNKEALLEHYTFIVQRISFEHVVDSPQFCCTLAKSIRIITANEPQSSKLCQISCANFQPSSKKIKSDLALYETILVLAVNLKNPEAAALLHMVLMDLQGMGRSISDFEMIKQRVNKYSAIISSETSNHAVTILTHLMLDWGVTNVTEQASEALVLEPLNAASLILVMDRIKDVNFPTRIKDAFYLEIIQSKDLYKDLWILGDLKSINKLLMDFQKKNWIKDSECKEIALKAMSRLKYEYERIKNSDFPECIEPIHPAFLGLAKKYRIPTVSLEQQEATKKIKIDSIKKQLSDFTLQKLPNELPEVDLHSHKTKPTINIAKLLIELSTLVESSTYDLNLDCIKILLNYIPFISANQPAINKLLQSLTEDIRLEERDRVCAAQASYIELKTCKGYQAMDRLSVLKALLLDFSPTDETKASFKQLIVTKLKTNFCSMIPLLKDITEFPLLIEILTESDAELIPEAHELFMTYFAYLDDESTEFVTMSLATKIKTRLLSKPYVDGSKAKAAFKLLKSILITTPPSSEFKQCFCDISIECLNVYPEVIVQTLYEIKDSELTAKIASAPNSVKSKNFLPLYLQLVEQHHIGMLSSRTIDALWREQKFPSHLREQLITHLNKEHPRLLEKTFIVLTTKLAPKENFAFNLLSKDLQLAILCQMPSHLKAKRIEHIQPVFISFFNRLVDEPTFCVLRPTSVNKTHIKSQIDKAVKQSSFQGQFELLTAIISEDLTSLAPDKTEALRADLIKKAQEIYKAHTIPPAQSRDSAFNKRGLNESELNKLKLAITILVKENCFQELMT